MKKKNRSRLDRRRLKNTNLPDRWPMNMIHTNTNTPDDRLSSLPDDVICHILSFLPTTKTSVQTSLLAKGWRRLWTRVTSLNLTIENPADWKTVNEVMLQHTGQTIQAFTLFCSEAADDHSELIGTWISTVLDRKVHTIFIYLHYYHDDQFKWPPHLSASETLVKLSLTNCCEIPTTGPTRFPALKRLVLDGVNDSLEEPLPRLLSNCPVLEDLSIQMVNCHKNIEICSTTLTRLTIGSWDDWDSTTDYSPRRVYMLKLNTPKLRRLYLRSGQYEVISAGMLNYVTHANADCCVRDCVESDSDDEYSDAVERSKVASFRNTVLEFVGKLYNVECLTLKCPLIVPYPTFLDSAPRFRNLTELDLWGGFCFLKYFLENADSLRSLTIGGRDTGPWTEPRYWEEPEQVPTCLKSSLETVNLLDFMLVSSREFEAARYILKNGKVLKMMTISTRVTPFYRQYYDHRDKSNKDKFEATKNEKFNALKQLALFERGSNACQLDFEILSY